MGRHFRADDDRTEPPADGAAPVGPPAHAAPPVALSGNGHDPYAPPVEHPADDSLQHPTEPPPGDPLEHRAEDADDPLGGGRPVRRSRDVAAVVALDREVDEVLDLVEERLRVDPDRPVLVVRADRATRRALADAHPQVTTDDAAGCALVGAWPRAEGRVGVLSGGPSDRAVAAEVTFVARALGTRVSEEHGLGPADLERLVALRSTLDGMDCVVVVTGLDGALAALVSAACDAPVIAVPTSGGYGATLGGVPALLALLTTSAPGVTVCGIDHGYGAALSAARIARRSAVAPPAKRRRRRAPARPLPEPPRPRESVELDLDVPAPRLEAGLPW